MRNRNFFIIALCLGFLVGCTVPSDRAMHVLNGAGYTEINLGDRAWYGCSQDDSMNRKFVAKGPSGRRVSGVVCCGAWAKSCTVRLD
jgi:hypothetical protein